MSTPTDYGEPWLIEDDGTFWEVYPREGDVITEEVIRDTDYGRRMLSCVNACAGIEDPAEALKAVRNALNGMLNLYCEHAQYCDGGCWNAEEEDEVIAARKALELLTPKP